MTICVNQVFATAVEEWYAAACAGAPETATLWARVTAHGLENLFLSHGARVAAAEAVLDGEAVVFGGQVLPAVRTMTLMSGGAEAGAATVLGLGIGLIGLAVIGGMLWVAEANRRDMQATKNDALYLYIFQYWPRYLRFAKERLAANPSHAVPQPMTFPEFFANRGSRTTVLGRRGY